MAARPAFRLLGGLWAPTTYWYLRIILFKLRVQTIYELNDLQLGQEGSRFQKLLPKACPSVLVEFALLCAVSSCLKCWP